MSSPVLPFETAASEPEAIKHAVEESADDDTVATAPRTSPRLLTQMVASLSPVVILAFAFAVAGERLGEITIAGISLSTIIVAVAVVTPLLSQAVSAPMYVALDGVDYDDRVDGVSRHRSGAAQGCAAGRAGRRGHRTGARGLPRLGRHRGARHQRVARPQPRHGHADGRRPSPPGASTRWCSAGWRTGSPSPPSPACRLVAAAARRRCHAADGLIVPGEAGNRPARGPGLGPHRRRAARVGWPTPSPMWMIPPTLWVLDPDHFHAFVVFAAIIPAMIGYQAFFALDGGTALGVERTGAARALALSGTAPPATPRSRRPCARPAGSASRSSCSTSPWRRPPSPSGASWAAASGARSR